MLLVAETLLRIRRLRGPLFGFGHARIWLLVIVLVLVLVVAWVNRNRR